jgi:gamma-glutamylputrescine oxidase
MKQAVYWYSRREPHAARRLAGEVRADVVVVGGGMMGLTCAQRLHAAGLSVALVERDSCGAGASGKSSGFITPASEIELGSLLAHHGPQEARKLWEFVSSGVELIRANFRDHAFACDFQVQDSLYVANKGRRAKHVREEHEARVELGYPSRFYEGADVLQVLGTSRYAAGVRHGGTFSIDPFAYCQALRDLLEARGVAIFEGSAVTRLRADGVDTAHGSVRARHVVVCTDRFLPELGALEDEIYHVQTFLGMSSPLPQEQILGMFPDGLAMTWDSDLVYNYFRVAGPDRLLLGGGDLLHTYAHSPASSLAGFARGSRAYFEHKFPGVVVDLEFVWSGMLGVSKDLLPVMGADRVHDSIWYAGAATGLPWAAALGVYAAERIIDARRDFDELFSPDRKFVIGRRMQAWLSTPLTFAISNGIAKRL